MRAGVTLHKHCDLLAKYENMKRGGKKAWGRRINEVLIHKERKALRNKKKQKVGFCQQPISLDR